MIFAILVMSIANIGTAWGENATFTMSTIFDGTNTSASVSSPVNATVSTSLKASKAAAGKLDTEDYYEVILTDDTFTGASFNGYINTGTTDGINWGFQFSTNGGTTWGSELTQANDGTKSAHDIAVGVSIPSGANGIRIIRKATTVSSYVYSITLTLAASSARTFKSGQTIFFKDAEGGNIGTLGKIWVSDALDVYAYFYDDATPTPNGAFSETVRSLVLHEYGNGGAIYKFIVPKLGGASGVDHEWTGVVFTRGSAASWVGSSNQTQDQEPSKGKNLFTISKDNPDGSGKYKGDWSVYANGAAIVGDMNDWIPDGGEFYYGGGTTGTVYMDLAADAEYDFKVLDGTGWKGCDATISNTTSSWYNFTGGEIANCKLQTGEAGNYAFKYDNSNSTNKWVGVYYPQARLTKNKYIYFDASNLSSSYWNKDPFSVKFVFKPYDNSSYEKYSVNSSYSTNVLEDHIYYAVVPDDDYLGFVRVDRWATDFSGSRWNYADDAVAYERTSSKQNCMITKDADKAIWDGLDQEWKIYCPPTTSETFTDNSTSVIAGTSGDGTSGSPYLVPTTGTIKVQASASKAVADGNMTINYDFKVDDSSAQPGEGNTYSKGSLSNNTTYRMSVDVYTVYNLDDSENSTKHTPTELYYKALNVYTISYNKGSNGTGDNTTAEKIYGISKTLLGVTFTRTGYTQTAWNTDPSGTGGTSYSLSGSYTGNADVTLYPTWTANPISVALAKGDHGVANQAATINYDATTCASFTAVSGNTGYRCTGYYDGETQVLNADGSFAADNVTGYITSGKWTKASDCTLTAHWTEQSYSITYKDEGDEDYSGSNEASLPDTHTYGAATALVPGVKTNYAFAGWYTTSTCTGDAITSIGATAYSSNITLYAKWVELALHEPGVYEKPEDLNGYGKALRHATISAEEHDYEVYWMTLDATGRACDDQCAGPYDGELYAGSVSTIVDGTKILTGSNDTEATSSDGWIAIKAYKYEGSDSRAAGYSEFSEANSTYGMKSSRYARIKNTSYVRLYVKGYDEFALMGSDASTSEDYFIIKIDGKTQLHTKNTSLYVERFSITSGDAHYIEIIGSSGTTNKFRGFSLRLPDVTRYTVSVDENNDSYGAVDVTSISNVRTGSTLYVDDNTFTVNGTTVTATPESSCSFVNWTVGGSTPPSTVTGNITMMANFSQSFSVTYNKNGATDGTAPSDATEYESGDKVTVKDTTGCNFVYSGYVFRGWNTENDGSGDYYAPGDKFEISSNTTLYAVWVAGTAGTVTYNLTLNSTNTSLDNCASATPTSGDLTASTDITVYGTAGAASSQGNSGKANETQKLKIDGTYTAANYYEWTCAIASGKTFTPSQVEMKFQAVSDLTQYKIVLTDGTTSYDSAFVQTTSTGNTLETLTWNIAEGDAFAASSTMRLKLWAFKKNDGATAFRLGSPITIKGVVGTAAAADYTLTWNFNGGGSTETAEDDYTAGGSVESGTTLVYPSNASMSKPGYRFNGWSSTPSTMPASDLTLTAQWVAFDLRTVSGLDVDAGATLSSIPLSWTIPGICDLKNFKEPIHIPISGSETDYGTLNEASYTADGDYVTASGMSPKWGQYGVGFDITSTSSLIWLSYEWKGSHSDVGLCGVACSNSNAYWSAEQISLNDDSQWNESGQQTQSYSWWTLPYPSPAPTVSQIVIYANAGTAKYDDVTFSVRNVRYGIDDDKEDIDHVVLMRKEGSAATGIADPSATKLYEGTKSHYTDASDVTGKNYYYTVFAVHANGAVSTGVSTSLTLYTITYNAGANGTGTVPAGKKTHGINFTLSSSTFTRDGFTQDGWSTIDGGDKVYELGDTYSTNEALTLYPHWVAVSGPVITNGSPSHGTISITDGTDAILSADAGETVYITATPNTGYNFTSWDVYKTGDASTKVSTAAATASTTFEMPSYAVTVNAAFTTKTYTVTLNGNGGSGNTANVTATYGSSSFSSSITNPTLLGYVFNGWYSGEGGTGTLIISSAGVLQSSTTYSDGSGNWTNDGAVTLYAKWTRDVKTAGWGAPWGGTAIPDATTSTVNSVTLNACNSAKGTLWSQESYKMGNGDSVTINLASGYYISAVSTAALFDEYGGNTNKLYIQFNSQSTYTNSKYDLDDPITLGDDCYDKWGTLGDATPVSVSPISAGAQSAKIYCSGNSASGNYLYRIIVEITAWDCTPSTVTFAAGGGTGAVPLEREICGDITLPGPGSLKKKGNTFAGWNDGEDDYEEGDTYTVAGDVTLTALWTPFTVPTATGLAVDEDFAITWNVPGKLDLSTASLSNSDPDYFIQYQVPADSKSYDSSTEELTVTYSASAWDQEGVALPFTGTNLETITYEYKGHRVFPAVVKSDGSKLYWEYDVVESSDSWTTVTRTPTTVYSNSGTVTPLPTAKAITFCANPNEKKDDESFYIRNVFYHLQNQIDVDHVVLMRKEGSAATDTTEAGTSVLLYSGKMSHYTDETIEPGKTYYYTIFSVHADGTLSAGTTQSATVPKDDLDVTATAGTASSITQTSATLSFTLSSTTGVASVTLKVYDSEDELVATVAGVTAATSGSGEITGLDAGTTYYFTVTPIGDATHNDGAESTKSSTFTTSAATLSALVAGTLYEVPDMIPSGASLTSDDQFFDGLSANTKFELIGSGSGKTTPKVNNNSSNDRTIADITFDDGSMWFKGNATVSKNIPSTFGLSFIVPSAGKLYLYFDDDDTSTNIKLAKSGTSGSKPTVSSGYSVVDVTSGTYYMYGTSTSAPYSFYGLKFVPTYDITLHDNNGGSNNGSAAVAVNGTTLLDIDAPTRSGYAVTGYYAEAECTTLVADAEGNLEANVTVSAVEWTDEDGKWIKGSDATLYAKWGVVFTVTFNTNGGSTVDPITQTTVGGSITMPAAPSKSGYTFAGWQMGSTYAAGASYTPTANVTAYATWKETCAGDNTEVYNGENVDRGNTTASGWTINSSSTMTKTSGSSNGYSYWYLAGSSNNYVQFDGSMALVSGDQIKIQWTHTNGSDKTLQLTINGSSASLTSGSTANSSNLVEAVYDVTSTTTVTSIKLNSSGSSGCIIYQVTIVKAGTCYYVTYDGNGATSGYVNDPTQYAEDATVYVSSSTGSYTRDGGYEFNGWNTKADGSGDKIAYFTITKDTTLYAQWRIVVNTNTTNLTAYDDPKHKDVRVTNGATLTLTQDTTVRNITVETGSTLNISKNGDDGIKFTVKSLSMKGGWGTVGGDTKYDMPRVFINEESSLVKTGSNIVNFDIAVDERNYYPIALPFDVALNDVNYVNSTLSSYVSSHRETCYGTYFAIKEYDGAKRAERGGNSENWKLVEEGTLTPGKGYILSAVTVPGLLDADPYAVIRFPMSFTNAWTTEGEQGTVSEVTKNVIEVTAYEKAEGETAKTNKGWNLLGIPYMSCYQTGADMYTGDGAAAIMQGKFDFKTNSFKEDEICYVSVPTHDFSEYLQYNIVDEATKLLPGWCFFVQVEKTGNLTYVTEGESASSSLPIYAPQREQEHKPTVKTGIILSSADASDKTTILVSDKYSATDYEINADLEKMFGENSYTLATYSLMGTTRLAYNAMSNAEARNVIPIGYRAPADGEYTFAINPRYAENFEHVNLIDYETGLVTDLLQSTYTFATERTQNDERFALNVVTRQDTVTDIENGANGGNGANGVRKLIIEDKMFIIVDGRMYDAKGVMVK